MAKATILVIDDHPAIRSVLSMALTHAGYTVKVAATGIEGLEQCQAHHVDLIITDIFMPGADGLTVIAILKIGHPNVKLIAMTGMRGEHNFLEVARLLGADAILQKPLDLSCLFEVVKQQLANNNDVSQMAGAVNLE